MRTATQKSTSGYGGKGFQPNGAGSGGSGSKGTGSGGTSSANNANILHERFSPRTVVVSIAVTGLVIGAITILFGLGLIVQREFAKGSASSLQAQPMDEQRVNCWIKAGNLVAARAALEKEEDARGLSPTDSVKLDRIYLALAKQSMVLGDKSGATKVLLRIPKESPCYAEAQSEIKKMNSPKVQPNKKNDKKGRTKSKVSAKRHHI